MKLPYFDRRLFEAADAAVLWIWNEWGFPRIDVIRYALIVWMGSHVISRLSRDGVGIWEMCFYLMMFYLFSTAEKREQSRPVEVSALLYRLIRESNLLIAARAVFYFFVVIVLANEVLSQADETLLSRVLYCVEVVLCVTYLTIDMTIPPLGPRNKKKREAKEPSLKLQESVG